MSHKTVFWTVWLVGIMIFWGAFWATHAEDATVPGKWYVVATVKDGPTDRVYGQLRYNGAGPFDEKAACTAWMATEDETFKTANIKLTALALERFGPATVVTFDCLLAPDPANKI